MFMVAYTVDKADTEKELEWLKLMKIVPTVKGSITIDSTTAEFKEVSVIGAIVTSEALLSIKLKRTIEMQRPWKQR